VPQITESTRQALLALRQKLKKERPAHRTLRYINLMFSAKRLRGSRSAVAREQVAILRGDQIMRTTDRLRELNDELKSLEYRLAMLMEVGEFRQQPMNGFFLFSVKSAGVRGRATNPEC
jgi:hypothetical protein